MEGNAGEMGVNDSVIIEGIRWRQFEGVVVLQEARVNDVRGGNHRETGGRKGQGPVENVRGGRGRLFHGERLRGEGERRGVCTRR